MAVSNAVKLEREKRKTERERQLMAFLSNPAILDQLALIGGVGSCFLLGKSRIVDRNLAGLLAGLSAVVSVSRAGVHDRYALAVVWAAVAATYAAAVRPTAGETILELQPGSVLGSDDKLFWWSPEDVAGVLGGPLGIAYHEIQRYRGQE